MGFPKLTEAQREPLFELVKYQQQMGKEQLYRRVNRSIGPNDALSLCLVEDLDVEVVQMWFERGYVTCRGYGGDGFLPGGLTLVLAQEALDYHSRMSKPRAIRAFLDWWDGAAADARTALFGIIGGVVGGLLLLGIQLLVGL